MSVINIEEYQYVKKYTEELKLSSRSKQLCEFLDLHERVKTNKFDKKDIYKGIALCTHLKETAITEQMLALSQRYLDVLNKKKDML